MKVIKAVRKKPLEIEYVKFETNNEAGSPHMDAIVNWVNKGRSKEPSVGEYDQYAWHNGTDIFLHGSLSFNQAILVGNFMVKDESGKFSIRNEGWIQKWEAKADEK